MNVVITILLVMFHLYNRNYMTAKIALVAIIVAIILNMLLKVMADANPNKEMIKYAKSRGREADHLETRPEHYTGIAAGSLVFVFWFATVVLAFQVIF